jgi:hypothetical protein
MHSVIAPVAFAAGLILLVLGERMFGLGHALRMPVTGAAALVLLLALAVRAKAWLGSQGEAKTVLLRLVGAYGVALICLALYAWTAVSDDTSTDTMVIVQVAWPIVFLAGATSVVFMEMSLRSMVGAARLETRRLLDSGRAGLAIALATSWLFALNYVAAEKDERIDLRSLKTLEPSNNTVEMVRNVAEPTTITLFFPPGNDVAQQVEPYFKTLADAGENVTLERLDRDMHPARAKELRARKNGTVVITSGDNHESLALDVDPDKARRKLKKLDGNFQEKFSKATREQRVAYVVTGHGERTTSPKVGDPSGLKALKEGLKRLNFKVKKLGPSEGLANEVPEDATVVFVIGPQHPMLESEQASLVRFLKGGGSMMLLADPEFEQDPELDALLEVLGVTLDLTPLAHETKYVKVAGGLSDRAFIYSNRFTTHDSTTNLAKRSSRLAVLFGTTGSLDKREGAENPPDVKFTVRSMSGTWADGNSNLTFDKDAGESKKVRKLVAAVQLPAPEGAEKGGRAIVGADADIITDMLLGGSMGNSQWLSDALRWLEGEVQLAGEVAEVEDVPILHTRDEDKAWFFGTTLGIPFFIIALGFGVTRRRRKGVQS